MAFDVDIEQLNKALQYLDIKASAYETQGALCGLLCGNPDITAQDWLKMYSGDREQGDLLAKEATEALTQLYTETVATLFGNALEFYPLLPQNEEPGLQLQGIADWAQGFLFGLGMAGIKNFTEYPSEVAEFIQDMTSVSRAEDYELANDDSDEEAIVQLIEFIRVGVLLVNEEMNPLRLPIEIPEDQAFGTLPADGAFTAEGSYEDNFSSSSNGSTIH